MESRMSKSAPSSPPPEGEHSDAAAGVTSQLYLHRPAGPGAGVLEKDAVLRRIRHRRRANRLQDTLRSLLVQQQAAPESDGDGERPTAWLDDSFSSA